MASDLSFSFRDQDIPVKRSPSVSLEIAKLALESEVFKKWVTRCEQKTDGKQIDLHGVEIQHVDMFGPRVGFVKINADSRLVDGKTKHEYRLPGICFLRGGSVAILLALICEELDGEVFSILVEQPRVPIGTVSCLELPAGMIDSENDGIAGTAARELQEECGIKLRPSELADLTALTCGDAMKTGNIPCAGIAPSPGGCDEFIQYMYAERLVTERELDEMRGRLSGLRDEGEFITLRLVALKDLWKVSADNKAICALFLADQLRKDGRLPPIGGLLPTPKDPIVRLGDGRVIPSLAFGLYKVPKGPEGIEIISNAIRAGYRHFDTASLYENEMELGHAIRLSGLPRESFFIGSKVWNDAQKEGPDAVRKSVEKTLKNLNLGYLDLMYVHWPVPGHFVDTYKTIQEYHAKGGVRNIGISNFGIDDFDQLMKSDGITVRPAVNQIEISPFMYRPKTIEYFQKQGVVMVASKALHRGSGFEEDTLTSIAQKYEVTPAQILLRWGIQKGLAVATKTSSYERMLENRRALDVSLSDEDVASLDNFTTEDQIRERELLEVERRNNV